MRSMEKSNDIGNRTRNLPACSVVPQPTTLPRAPTIIYCCIFYIWYKLSIINIPIYLTCNSVTNISLFVTCHSDKVTANVADVPIIFCLLDCWLEVSMHPEGPATGHMGFFWNVYLYLLFLLIWAVCSSTSPLRIVTIHCFLCIPWFCVYSIGPWTQM
jgi:hypothetical protein